MKHGHVNPNPDGSTARCGGPGICTECNKEWAESVLNKSPLPTAPLKSEKEAMTKEQIMHDALDHIAKVAGMARTLTKRLDWIVARAKTAIQGDEWDNSYKPMPTSDLPGRQRLKAECEKLREELAHEKKLSEAISHHCNENALERNRYRDETFALKVQLSAARAEERERCKKAVSEAGWLHLGDDAHSKRMDRTAIQQVNSCVEAIEALGDAE